MCWFAKLQINKNVWVLKHEHWLVTKMIWVEEDSSGQLYSMTSLSAATQRTPKKAHLSFSDVIGNEELFERLNLSFWDEIGQNKMDFFRKEFHLFPYLNILFCFRWRWRFGICKLYIYHLYFCIAGQFVIIFVQHFIHVFNLFCEDDKWVILIHYFLILYIF